MPRTTPTHLQPFLTPTGDIATVERLRTGDSVLVWTHANSGAPQRTWGAVAAPNSTWPLPADREDYIVQEAVIARLDQQWHSTAARRGIALGMIVSTRPHYGDGPPAWPDGTVDVAMPRADLIDGSSLVDADIDHGAPVGLDADDWPLDDEQLKHYIDAARRTGLQLLSHRWPPNATALDNSARQYLPEKLRLWRSNGVPLHIRTLRRLAQEHGTAPYPGPDTSRELLRLLRPGDLLDCDTRSDPATGLPAHAVGVGPDSRYPSHVAEINSQWWHSACEGGAAVGTYLATADDGKVLAAMTDDDFEAAIALAGRSAGDFDDPQRGRASAVLFSLQDQYDNSRGIGHQHGDPEFAAQYIEEYGGPEL